MSLQHISKLINRQWHFVKKCEI